MTPPPDSSSGTSVAATPVEDILETFRRDGIAVARFSDLLGDELWQDAVTDITPFVASTEAEAARLGARERGEGKDEVIVRRFYEKGREAHRYALSDAWLRIAASETVLDIVNGYAGAPARLTYVDNWYTVPYPLATERVASQRWHRDPEDDHIVKMFVYFSEVDEGAGPFEYVRQSAAGAKYGELFAWRDGHRYPSTDELEAAVDPADRLTLTGPAGTVIFCDTGGFHRGGFARTSPRILMISTFLRESARKGKRRYAVDFEGREDTLSAQARHALAG
ncbi:MAG TPA: hypothetical protein VFB35_03060 [Gaiellaceae bacterium]|nr:hypothetical protein [Gaiellaceae bacterium]